MRPLATFALAMAAALCGCASSTAPGAVGVGRPQLLTAGADAARRRGRSFLCGAGRPCRKRRKAQQRRRLDLARARRGGAAGAPSGRVSARRRALALGGQRLRCRRAQCLLHAGRQDRRVLGPGAPARPERRRAGRRARPRDRPRAARAHAREDFAAAARRRHGAVDRRVRRRGRHGAERRCRSGLAIPRRAAVLAPHGVGSRPDRPRADGARRLRPARRVGRVEEAGGDARVGPGDGALEHAPAPMHGASPTSTRRLPKVLPLYEAYHETHEGGQERGGLSASADGAAAATLLMPARAASKANVEPSGNAAPPPPRIGQDSLQVERLARAASCSAQPVGVLVEKGPGFETYTVSCSAARTLSFRCEFGNCRSDR